LVGGRKLLFDIKSAKRSIFMACNAILSHTKHTEEIIQLSLQESYFLSILTYGVTAVSLNVSQYNELKLAGTLCTENYSVSTSGNQ